MIGTNENYLREKFKPYLCESFSPLLSKAGSLQVGLNLFSSLNPAELTVSSIKKPYHNSPHCALTTFSQRATRIIRTRSTSRAIEGDFSFFLGQEASGGTKKVETIGEINK